MKHFLLFCCLLLSYIFCFAQDESFETSVPAHWTTSSGTLSISDDHYKTDSKSLKWDWVANDEITVVDLQSHGLVEDEVWHFHKNRFRIWVYNTNPIATTPISFEFYDEAGILQFHYDLQMDYTGWRAGTVSYRYDMFGDKAVYDLTTLKIKAPNSGSGTIYFDNIDYTLDRQPLRKPDYQIPFIATNGGEHWQDEYYYESLPKTVPLETPTATELSDLAAIKAKYDNNIMANSPSSSELSTAVNRYNNLNITYANNIVKGVPLFGADGPGIEISTIDEFIHVLARDYKHNGTATSLDYFIKTVRHTLDQGYAKGSLLETTHHIGYGFRNVSKAIHLMKAELEAEGLWAAASGMVEWYVTLNIIWHPTAESSNMDETFTNAFGQLGAILYKESAAEKVQYLKGFKKYLEIWLTPHAQEGEGLKVDYTGFHHNTYYPGYCFGGFNGVAVPSNYMSGTSFSISTSAFQVLRKLLLVSRITLGGNQLPNSLTGRHPFTNVNSWRGLYNTGLSSPVDVGLLQAYNKITGGHSTTNAYGVEDAPNGFWQINFANMGIYRQSDWVANIKGFNNYFWGAEIYTADGRYSRYQSYGAIEIMQDGLSGSAFNINGWNWNMPPGTTTIHLPWNSLVALSNRQDETTDSRFAAALRFGNYGGYIDPKLEGQYGIFGMDFQQKAVSVTHNTSFTFKKSVFCIDGKLICLGSGINNNDSANLTATNLFQNHLTSTANPITINNAVVNAFPYNTTIAGNTSNWILDAINTGYYIANGDEISINRQNQASPNENGNGTTTYGDFATAYINHGKTPDNKKYEYVIIPATTAAEMATFSNNMATPSTVFYSVLQQDEAAHIVKQHSAEVYGYALFQAGNYSGTESLLLSNDKPCLVMLKDSSFNLALSIVNPDLNFVSNNGPSQAISITLEIAGDRSLLSATGGAVLASSDGTNTTLIIQVKDALPVDVLLSSTSCVTTHTLTGTETATVLYKASENISSNQVISETAQVVYNAGIGITFLPGFETFSGAFLDALIDDCTPSEISQKNTSFPLKEVNKDIDYSKTINNVSYFDEDSGFSITPNPTRFQAIISIKEFALSNQNQLIVFNDFGRVIKQIFIGKTSEYTLSLNDLPNGIYSVLLQNERRRTTQRLVKIE